MHICKESFSLHQFKMKHILLFAALLVAPLFVRAQASGKAPAFNWTKTVYDFGKIKKGIPTTAEFKYTNSGKAPLMITDAKGSCGCTVPEYTKEALAPGKTGVVKATYNAANPGAFTKTVTISSNAEGGPVILTIKGEVVEEVAAK
jgi:hypothetical protein